MLESTRGMGAELVIFGPVCRIGIPRLIIGNTLDKILINLIVQFSWSNPKASLLQGPENAKDLLINKKNISVSVDLLSN